MSDPNGVCADSGLMWSARGGAVHMQHWSRPKSQANYLLREVGREPGDGRLGDRISSIGLSYLHKNKATKTNSQSHHSTVL
jgi:hypothetical protein